MFASRCYRLLIGLAVAASGLPGCCEGVFGPAPQIECPASVDVGQEVTLTVRNVDDGVVWRQISEGNAQGLFIANGNEEVELVTGGSGVQQAIFRAEVAGTIIITAEEVLIGAPICFPPYPELSSVTCTIMITD